MERASASKVRWGCLLAILGAFLLPFQSLCTDSVHLLPQGLAIQGSNGNYSAQNPAHGFAVGFTSSGFSIQGTAPMAWKLGLELQGIGRGEAALRPGAIVRERLSGARLEQDHGAFELHYTNSLDGMRHDIVVHRRPEGEGALEARLMVTGGLLATEAGPGRVVFHAFDAEGVRMCPVLEYSGLHVWDSRGLVLRSRMVLQGEMLILVVEDGGASYPITIDPLSSTPDAVLTGTAATDDHGFAIATAGDVNGDGYSDVLVAAPGMNGRKGYVALYLGGASGISAAPAWSQHGLAANDEFGYSVSTAGDVNGDGYSDVVIGAPGESGCGAIHVYLGGPGGLGSGMVRYGDSQAGSRFGHSVAMAGDVNGDGFSDVIAGCPLFDNSPGTDHGKAFLYHGSTSGIAFFPSWTATGGTSSGHYGTSVCGTGDLDGDGYGDIAIGAPYEKVTSPPNQVRGKVYLFKGSSAGLGATASSVLSGPAKDGEFGFCIAGVGDVNGDGYADLVVGAPGVSNNAGRVDLYLGTSSATLVGTASAANRAGTTAERLGARLSTGGDLNGDGYADIIVGAPGYSSGRGRVLVFHGGTAVTTLLASPGWNKTGGAGENMGLAVNTAGDVNGDGISDLLVTAPGAAGGLGEVRVFHGGASLPATTHAWSLLGGANYMNLGRCVATAGDVNADGYADVLVGIPGYNGRKGRAMLFLGSASGLSPTPAWTVDGEFAQDQFGFSVASAGDVNGDGYSDVLIGAPSYPAYDWTGKVYLYMGGPGGLSTVPAWVKTGDKLDDRFGWSVASAGDVNGDGYSDVAIGAYMFRVGSTDHGKAFVFHGSATGLGATADWSVTGSMASFYGVSLSTAGDVNGDGYDDLIVGAPFWDVDDGSGSTSHNNGAAFVYHGSPTGLSPVANWSIIGAGHGYEFGHSVSYAGDVNGDGYSDVVIGEIRSGLAPSTPEVGRAFVYLGQPTVGLATTPATVITGVLEYDRLGSSVCSAGDVNGDGFSDIVVGVPYADFMFLNQGKMQVHFGSATGISPTPDLELWGPNTTNAKMGTTVALAGDVDGDGFSDLVVGADVYSPTATDEGGAFLYLGGAGMARPTYQYRSNLTTPVRTSNGTFETTECNWGIGQLAHSSMGRGKVKLAWEYRGHGPGMPSGVLFPNNSTAFTGEGGAWTDSGLNGVLIKEALNGPLGSSHPAWRVRVRHHPATAIDGRPFGRWFVQGIHDLQVPSLKTDLTECGPLPVTLLGSDVFCREGHVVVRWTTASEKDCEKFVVMRSEDGTNWQAVAVVPGSGNTSHVVKYEAEDPQPLRGRLAYYRLDQYDHDGGKTTFPVMVLMPCKEGVQMDAWPNPACCELYLSLGTPLEEEMLGAELFDITGRMVLRKDGVKVGGGIFRVDGLGALPPGAYLVVLSSPKQGLLGQMRVVKD